MSMAEGILVLPDIFNNSIPGKSLVSKIGAYKEVLKQSFQMPSSFLANDFLLKHPKTIENFFQSFSDVESMHKSTKDKKRNPDIQEWGAYGDSIPLGCRIGADYWMENDKNVVELSDQNKNNREEKIKLVLVGKKKPSDLKEVKIAGVYDSSQNTAKEFGYYCS